MNYRGFSGRSGNSGISGLKKGISQAGIESSFD
jgi:hypothetical protein